MDRPEGTRQQRRWFLAALAMFLLWVAALTVLAVKTASKPEVRPAPVSGR